MKTLFVTIDPAFPPTSGADLRSWQNVTAARKLGPVLLLSMGLPQSVAPPPGIKIAHLDGTETSKLWASDFDVIFSSRTAEHLSSISQQFQPDVTVLESLPLANLADVARKHSKALVIDMHNVESDLAAQEVDASDDAAVKRALQMRVKRIASLEQQAAASVDVVWVCSSEDRDRFLSSGVEAKCISIVPNGIPGAETISFKPKPPRRHVSPILLFIGHLRYGPNVEAALWLIQFMSLLWKCIPGARLVLAGRDPHPLILKHSDPGRVDVVINPRSVSDLLSTADIAVMPLRRGGGTRIKALEAMAWGLPIVATSRAVEGLRTQNGVHVRIAETAEAFVAAVVELCERGAIYECQRSAAQRHVEDNFRPDIIRRAVREGLYIASRRGKNITRAGK